MAKANSTQPIPPFPADLDREAFACWLSGFVAGEGSFQLRINSTQGNPIFSAAFVIKMRADELPILRQIQSFFGCGKFTFQRRGRNPTYGYLVGKTMELSSAVVPHFTAYPLWAKKARDFAIWRDGVALLAGVWHRPTKLGPRRRDGTVTGTVPRWTLAEAELFRQLHNALRRQRNYSPDYEPNPRAPLG